MNYDLDKETTIIFGSITHTLGRFIHQRAREFSDYIRNSINTKHSDYITLENDVNFMWKFDSSFGNGLETSNTSEYEEIHVISISIQALICIVNGLSYLVKEISD